MMKSDYQINSGNITSHSEETSAVSKLAMKLKMPIIIIWGRKIRRQIVKLQKGQFPKNLKYVDSYTDPKQVRLQVPF